MNKIRIISTIITVMWIILGVANIAAWATDLPVQPCLLNGILFVAIGTMEFLNMWLENHDAKD